MTRKTLLSINIYEIISCNLSDYNLARQKPCTARNFSTKEIVQSISAALPALQFFLWFDPWFPSFPGRPPQSVSRDPSSKFKQNVPLVELRVMLFAFCLCLSFPASSVKSAPETLLPYYLFDILVRCFSYCCPTLVVRRTVLLPKALNWWTGLYYQR